MYLETCLEFLEKRELKFLSPVPCLALSFVTLMSALNGSPASSVKLMTEKKKSVSLQ